MANYIHVPEGAPVVPKLDVTVDEHDYRAGALKLIKTLRPHWKPSEVKMKSFTDGITNKLIGCYVGGSMQNMVLVRVYGNKTELFVDRENEVKSFRVLHAHRCAPRLYCTFNNGLCYEFLQGVALEPEHIRSPAIFRLIARQMAKYHAIHAHNGWVPQSDLWLKISKFFSLVPTHFKDPEMDQRLNSEVPSAVCLRDEMIWLKQSLSKLGSPVVLCHNDLLCKNIIYNQEEDVSLPKSLHLLHRAIATDWRCSVCPARTPPGPEMSNSLTTNMLGTVTKPLTLGITSMNLQV
ncbi:ethanolamine kinase 1-like isoform X2 [Myxocyprinus asiaticus]|uniref:ethanolamine kinase 1-like isoform X2 n=1 Tax=Myxocyprinus asiaticus TaxID=70543 RepID=UPI002221C3B2|nr:ethanolamine kinase 1-like isoform X2 [Myxocyprinus asiaticus]